MSLKDATITAAYGFSSTDKKEPEAAAIGESLSSQATRNQGTVTSIPTFAPPINKALATLFSEAIAVRWSLFASSVTT
ncbi:hypothetical protein [Parasphaerochaeta coccoides]|uniref:hypothetical protein n=1 Tax=Parasphaerochaeta coccoides TaxID=273376 RepID=UPI0002F744F9|nr:hypothetical protein [Parasphaerochaeta coccoides]